MKEKRPRGAKPQALGVTERQEGRLKGIIRRKKSPQDLVRRAKIILAASSEARNQHIAADLGTSRLTVRTWRQRWLGAKEALQALEQEEDDGVLEAHILAVLADRYRSGAPATFSAEQICQIMAIACEDPKESGRPITAWTPSELADEAIKRKIVKSISERQVGRFLKGERSKTPSMALLA